jgi:hypothetical protein
MRNLREVLRLSYSAGLSIREISVGSIQNILKMAKQLKLAWPLPDDWDDQTLVLKFYPRSDAKPSSKYQEPVWSEIHLELKKKGFTKQLLWDDCMDAGGTATQEQLPKNILSYIRIGAIATRSSAPATPIG